jgi:hypothetical protein
MAVSVGAESSSTVCRVETKGGKAREFLRDSGEQVIS